MTPGQLPGQVGRVNGRTPLEWRPHVREMSIFPRHWVGHVNKLDTVMVKRRKMLSECQVVACAARITVAARCRQHNPPVISADVGDIGSFVV